MEELIAKLDAEITAVKAEVDAVEASIADKRTKLNRLRQARDSLTGAPRKPPGYIAKKPRGPHGTTREKIAALLEERGAMRTGEIAKVIGVGISTPYQVMRNHPWFVMNGSNGDMFTTWSLTEAGRNRHKTPTESAP